MLVITSYSIHYTKLYEVSIDGRIYYEYYDTIYKKVETNRGYAYEVVGQLDWN